MSTENPILDALQKSVIINRRDKPDQIAWTEWRANIASGCPAPPGSIVMTGAGGTIDPCLLPPSPPSNLPVYVNGNAVPFGPDSPDFNSTTPAAPAGYTNVIWQYDPSGNISAYYATSGIVSVPFSEIISGTSTGQSFVVGDGTTLTVACPGSGVIEATELATSTCTPVATNISAPAHPGQLLISQPGNASAVWADPFVQGVSVPGTSVLTGFSGGPIQPVLVGAQDPSNLLQNLRLDALYNLLVDVTNTVMVTGTVAVTQSTSPWITQIASGGVFSNNLNQDGSGNVGVNIENAPTVSVSNFPSEFEVTQGTTPWIVKDAAAESSLAALASTVGTGGSPAEPVLNVNVVNQTSGSSDVTIIACDVALPVSGTVAVSNFPPFPVKYPIQDSAGGNLTSTGGSLNVNVTNSAGSDVTVISPLVEYGSPPQAAIPVVVLNQAGSAANVSIVSPLDGSGYVEVDLKTALPTGSNTIGSIGNTSFGVTGTVAVTQSTSPWVVEDVAAGSYLETIASTVRSAGSPAEPVINVNVVSGGGSPDVTIVGCSVTLPVSGTVTADQGTSPWIVKDSAAEFSLSGIQSILSAVETTAGSPAVPALNVNVVNEAQTSSCVTQCTSPWVVSGTVTADQGGAWNIGTLTSVANPVTVQQSNAANLLATSYTDDGYGNKINSTSEGSPATTGLNIHVQNTSPIAVSGTVSVSQPVAVTQSTSPWVVKDSAAEASLASIASAVTSAGSPATPALAVDVVASVPITATFTESQIGVTQVTNPWAVSGTVTADQGGSWTVGVTGTVAVTQSTSPWVVSNPALSGMSFTPYGSPATENLNVYVVNPVTATFTETQIGVTQSTSPWVVSGTVTANAGTGTFNIQSNASVNLTEIGGAAVSSGNPLYVETVPGSTTVVTGAVAVTNAALSELAFTNYGSPAVAGLDVYLLNPVAVSNFPASQVVTLASTTITGSVAVTGTFWQAIQPVSGTVGVTGQSYTNVGSPAVSALNVYSEGGTVAVSNFPATQPVSGNDYTDPNNSTTTPLGANSVFTGAATSTTGYSQLMLSIDSDQQSTGTSGILVQWSEDGTNWGDQDWGQFGSADVGTGQGYSFPIKRKYYRVVYDNGPIAQTYFRMQSILKVNTSVGRLMDLIDVVDPNTHAQVVRNVAFGHSSYGSGTFNDTVVKNPSTAAAASDPSLVVTMSPNTATVPVSGTVTISGTTVVSGTVAISGTTVVSNPALSEMTFTNYGSPAEEALNVYVVNPSSGNAAAGPTGSAVPADADYIGFNSGGSLVGVSSTNPLPITGSISATNPSVGSTGSTAPTSATEIGIIASGNLVGVGSSNPLPIVGNKTSNSAPPGSTNVGVLPALAYNQPVVEAQGNQVALTTDLQGNLRIIQSQTDLFGTPVVQIRDAQWQVNHSLGADATNITPTLTNSGTISYTAIPGACQLSTAGAVSSGANLLSVGTLDYQVGFEWFQIFTVAFPSVTGAVGSQVGASNSYMRIGFYNNSGGNPLDGFFVGFEGNSLFGITHFRAGTGQDSFSLNTSPGIPITSFNGDQCAGGSSISSFTSAGTPIAIDFTKQNLFRMRGGWLATGNVVLEVMSPDETWVTMHTFRNPNVLTQPYTSTTNWNYQVDCQNNASSTATNTMFVCGASFGSSSSETRITDAITPAWMVPTVRDAAFAQYLSSGYASPSSGNWGPLQMDVSGNLKVAAASAPYAAAGNAPAIVSISTSSTPVLASNPLRKGCNLVNMSFETISLAFGANAAVLYSGATLGPGGTFWMDSFDFTTAAINAISTNAAQGGYLGVQEFQ